MTVKKIVLISALSTLLVACASQSPAPVISAGRVVKPPKPALPIVPKAPEPKPIVETTPLSDYQIKDEPLQEIYTPAPEIQDKPLTTEAAGQNPELPDGSSQLDSTPPADAADTAGKPPVKPETPKPSAPQPPAEPVVEKHTPMPFEPFESQAAASPAVGALLADATQNSKSGEMDQAVATIERAIRIEPRNANLYYKLAVLRIKQSKPRLAEDLAKKSALLATNDRQLKKHSWLLVAKARDMLQDYAGSKEARNKADKF